MKKYEEISRSLKLGDYLDNQSSQDIIYVGVEGLIEKIMEDGHLGTERPAKERLFTMASCLIQVGSNMVNFRKTKEMLRREGIREEVIPNVMAGASLCYLVDRTIEHSFPEWENNSEIHARSLDGYLDRESMEYLNRIVHILPVTA